MSRERLLTTQKAKINKIGVSDGIKCIPGYKHDFLRTEDTEGKGERDEYKISGSQQYLEACSHSVDLSMLYEMQEEIGTCAHNEQMEYTPV